MEQIIVVMIWDKDDKALTRSVVVDKNTKLVKVNGKKPNKMIIPESLTNRVLLRKIKGMGTHTCVIVKAVGK